MKIIDLSAGDSAFLAEVEARSGQNLKTCYQCGNCTAGCPFTFAYDIPVSQIMRLVQSGQKETVLKSKSLWLCASCQSCTTRCPNNIDVAKVMDVCRHMARENNHVSERSTKLFVDAFLKSVEEHGRAFELGLMAQYTLKSGRLFDNIAIGPTALRHNKLSFKPHTIQGKDQVARIFERFRKGE